jgi:hypothetical protein
MARFREWTRRSASLRTANEDAAVSWVRVFREAVPEADDIYDQSGFIPRNTNAPATGGR